MLDEHPRPRILRRPDGRILGAVLEVSSTLGAGFLEKFFERTLLRELGLRDIRAAAQAALTVTYKGRSVGEYLADILVEDVLLIELKCVERLATSTSPNVSITCQPPA
jgi:GxxExxY protein